MGAYSDVILVEYCSDILVKTVLGILLFTNSIVMDQMKWIVGGGFFILAIAALLFIYSDKPTIPEISDLKTINQLEINSTPDTPKATSSATSGTQSVKTINQLPITKMEPTTSNATTAVLHTTMGDITVKLYAFDSPKTVENFVKLAKSGFYNGVKFHRVIKDFMIQTGDPLSKDDSLMNRWGQGGPGYSFNDEFNQQKLVRGSLAMANSGPNSNGSQFFIVTAESTGWLDGKHTNFGEVTDGMEVVMKIQSVATVGSDRPATPIIITSIDLK